MDDPVATKLSAARTRLILEKPFLGALVLRLPMQAGDPKWCRTTATDARGFYYNRDYVAGLSLEQTKFVLAHEALHCALSHFARRAHRVRHRWDLACDFAVNPLLVDEGLIPPPEVIVLDEYVGMTAEEIYPCIDDALDREPMDQHLYDNDSGGDGDGKGEETGEGRQTRSRGQAPGDEPQTAPTDSGGGAPAPPPLGAAERENPAVQWQQRLAGAAQQALQAGKLGGALARLVDHLLQPQLPWRMLLARYMTATARDDYSYARPSRREGAAILPSLRSQQLDLAVIVDTSGSIGQVEIDEFLSEVNAVKGQLRARILLHACDAQLDRSGPWIFEPWEDVRLPERLGGGGGTSFLPPFAWATGLDRAPDLLVYFTDADGEFPPLPPAFPVLWLVKGRGKVPWGQRIQLN